MEGMSGPISIFLEKVNGIASALRKREKITFIHEHEGRGRGSSGWKMDDGIARSGR